MTEYIVLIPGNEAELGGQHRGREGSGCTRKHREFAQAARGARPQGDRRAPSCALARGHDRAPRRTATTTVTDGPYAETVEQLTGFYLVETDDLDDLLEVCRVLAEGESAIEVRACAGRRRPDADRSDGRRVERSAALRDEWGRLLALLVAQYRRLDLAEDGLGRRRSRRPPAPGPRRRRTRPTRRRGCSSRPAAGSSTGCAPRRSPPASCPLLAVEAELTEEAQRTMADAGEPAASPTSGSGWCCSARTPSLPPGGRRRADPAAGARRLDRGPRPALPGRARRRWRRG